MSRRTAFILLLTFCAFALFWRLGDYGLTEPDEGRTAGIGYEFFKSGTWLMPRLYDLAQFNKPPLIYWACSLSYRIGGVNEWMARLPAALAALGTLLLTRSIARRLYGEREALAATLILLTAPMFFVMAHIIDPNMMLTFWITLSMWAAVAWFQDGKKFQQWIFWIALGIAFLAKGPPAVGIVGLTLVAHRYLPARDGKLWRGLFNLPAIVVCAVVGLSWFVISCVKFPELWHFFIGQELVGRLSGGIAGRSQPVWYFIPILLGGFLPWFPLLTMPVVNVVSRFRADPRFRLLTLWVVLPLIMFSLSKSKLPAYILPLFPPLAILAAAETAAESRWCRREQMIFSILMAALLVALLALLGPGQLGWDHGLIWRDAIWLLPAAAALLATVLSRGGKKLIGAAAFIVVTHLACIGILSRHENEIEAHSSPRKMCEALIPQLRPGDRVVLYKNYPRGVNFYLQYPLSFSDKFEPQIESDWLRLLGRLYKEEEVGQVYRWFDSEPRVFVITTDRKRGGKAGTDKSPLDFLSDGCRKKAREIYRDDKYVVVCNFPPA